MGRSVGEGWAAPVLTAPGRATEQSWRARAQSSREEDADLELAGGGVRVEERNSGVRYDPLKRGTDSLCHWQWLAWAVALHWLSMMMTPMTPTRSRTPTRHRYGKRHCRLSRFVRSTYRLPVRGVHSGCQLVKLAPTSQSPGPTSLVEQPPSLARHPPSQRVSAAY